MCSRGVVRGREANMHAGSCRHAAELLQCAAELYAVHGVFCSLQGTCCTTYAHVVPASCSP